MHQILIRKGEERMRQEIDEDYDEKEQEIRYDTEPEQTVIILNGSLYQIIDSEEELELPFW